MVSIHVCMSTIHAREARVSAGGWARSNEMPIEKWPGPIQPQANALGSAPLTGDDSRMEGSRG
jgi:hypothetical protein